MNVFWREQPLNETELELWNLVRDAHFQSCHRNNCSTGALLNSYQGSGDYTKALIGALSTLGKTHAPVQAAMENILCEEWADEMFCVFAMNSSRMVEGWGNSFIRGERDALWLPVDNFLKEKYPQLYGKIEGITKVLHDNGKEVYPNPACYTAAACIALGVPAKIAPFLFIEARLAGWTALILNQK
jgi:hypothetical protein